MSNGAGNMGTNISIGMFDEILNSDSYSVVSVKEKLMPAAGFEHPVAAAMYPAAEGTNPNRFLGGANIVDRGGTSSVIIDSIASAANRRDRAMLDSQELRSLLPTVEFEVEGKIFHIMEAPHRCADSSIAINAAFDQKLQAALVAFHNGDAAPLARLDVSSLIGGFWKSRAKPGELGGMKSARLICSQVVGLGATVASQKNVFSGSMGAQAINHDLGDAKQEISSSGHGRVPSVDRATNKVHVNEIISTTTVSLGGIRLFRCRTKEAGWGRPRTEAEIAEDLKLQRYVLGVALVKALIVPAATLRSECDLIQTDDPDAFTVALKTRARADRNNPGEIFNTIAGLDLRQAMKFCALAKEDFGVENHPKPFEIKKADIRADAGVSGSAADRKKLSKSQIVAKTEPKPSAAEV